MSDPLGDLWEILIYLFSMKTPYKTNSIILDGKAQAVVTKTDTEMVVLAFELFEILDFLNGVGLFYRQNNFLNALK